jgi:hypothetical protein
MYGTTASTQTGLCTLTPFLIRARDIIKELTTKTHDPVMANKRIKLLLDEIRSAKKPSA